MRVSGCVGTYSVDFLDAGIVRDDQVCKLGQELLRGGLADKQPNVLERVCSPRHEDQETDQDGADGIDEPSHAAADDGHGKTKSVDDNVVAVVDEEHMYRGVTTEDEAIGTERALGEDCDVQYTVM